MAPIKNTGPRPVSTPDLKVTTKLAEPKVTTKVTKPKTTTKTTSNKKAESSFDKETKKYSAHAEGSYKKDTKYSSGKTTTRDADISNFTDKFGKATDFLTKGLKALGIDKTFEGGFDNIKKDTLFKNDNVSVTAQHGTTGSGSVSINGEGIQAEGKVGAEASVTANAHGEVEGRYGKASYTATGTAEAHATAEGTATIDANGLNATARIGAGASVSVEATGHAETPSITIGGQEFKAQADGHVRATAEVKAEASGTATISRNPPAAILRGEAGASAVAKAEAEATISAGPFSVRASGYASAGAEAKASGVIGFEDGKLKIGGSLGAALGVGLGGSVDVEVDVAAIGEAAVGVAKDVADQNGDGKIGFDDIGAGVQNLAAGASRAAATVSNGIGNAAKSVASFFGW